MTKARRRRLPLGPCLGHLSPAGKDSRSLLDKQFHKVSRQQRLQSSSSLASIQAWIRDVVRTGSLTPSNPILDSLKMARIGADKPDLETDPSRYLPQFATMLPHHLENATHAVQKKCRKDLTALEERLSSSPPGTPPDLLELLHDMERVHAPLVQIQQVASLYTTLASPPDQIQAWRTAALTVEALTQDLPLQLYQSTVIYNAMMMASRRTGTPPPPSVVCNFHKQGVHIVDGSTDTSTTRGDGTGGSNTHREQLRTFHRELTTLNNRLQRVESYEGASKAVRLQCVSDMYNIIGLSALQASKMKVGTDDDVADAEHEVRADTAISAGKVHHRMVSSPRTELVQGLFPEILSFLQPHLPQRTKLNLAGAGAFLENHKPAGAKARPSDPAGEEELRAVWEANKRMKDCLRLHGVMQGVKDFCDAILGIRVEEEHPSSGSNSNSSSLGWNKNVRLVHLYKKAVTIDANGDDGALNDTYLGTIYLDPYRDPYWRTEDAKDLVMTELFSKNIYQTAAPVVIMALKINPAWDDAPTPMTWSDLRDFLYQFGKALQLILVQNAKMKNMALPIPIDAPEFLAHVSDLSLR